MKKDLSFRSILKNELERRVSRNPEYSLRAFARDLELPPGRMSSILQGKEGLSRLRATRIARRLGWSLSEVAYFCDLVEAEHARSETKRALARARLEQRNFSRTQRVQMDAFRVIADWQHLALRELVRTKNFRLDFNRLAQSLELPKETVIESWERLRRLDLVWQNAQGRWETADLVMGPDGVPSAAVRHYQGQVLKKAEAALHGHAVEDRYVSSIVFPFEMSAMPRAREMIQSFRQDACTKLESTAADQVYCLSVQLFRIAGTPSSDTKIGEEK